MLSVAQHILSTLGLLSRMPITVPILQLMLPAEYAHDIVMELGDLGMLQFKDLNADKSAFQRTYANQVGWSDRCYATNCQPHSTGQTL